MSRIEAIFYELPDGTRPAEEYLDSLDDKMRAKMLKIISLLEENDGDLREPYSKPLGDDIFELRAQVGNNISRIMYFFYVGNKAIMTNGFTKKTQKTPPGELKKAKKYREDFLQQEVNR